MARLFSEHIKRKCTSLNGAWKFITDRGNTGASLGYNKKLPAGDTVIVPGMWNNEFSLLEYEGIAWYEKDFYTEGGTLRFSFGAVMTEAKVYLDSEFIGSHTGGFTAFDFIVPDVSAGEHRLTVRVDNTFNDHSIPQSFVDWYHYGGISRDVTVETLRGVCILSSKLVYELSEDLSCAKATLKLELYNADKENRRTVINASLDTDTVFSGKTMLKGGEKTEYTSPPFEIDKIRLWDVGAPNLYTLIVETDTDDLYDRIGFRKVLVKDGKIILNNKPIEVRGINRHEDHPDFGFAFPEKLIKRDIDIIKDMNANAVRAHYPNTKAFLDYLDENGIMFWSEIPIWGNGYSEEQLADPAIVRYGLNMHKEMVSQYYNHPSIIFWGLHNEIKSYADGAVGMSKCYYEYLKAEGGNRIVTFASSRPMIDRCFEFCDIICINKYDGWYDGGINTWETFLDEFRERRRILGYSDKPVIFSEFGAAALYGHHTFDNIKWTEEYQSNLIAHTLKLFHNDPMVTGFFIWQFTDMRTNLGVDINRARGFNNKGILNEYRKPKAAYFTVRDLYRKFICDEGAEI
jgi:beta-glucuronidase